MSRELIAKDRELRQLVLQMSGQRLPGERELAQRLQLSRPRLRSMLTLLEAEGLIERRQGSGTYAVDMQADQLHTVTLLVDESLKLGNDPFFSLLLEHLLTILQEKGIRCVIERITDQRAPRSLSDGAITVGQAGKAVLAGLRSSDVPVVCLLLDTVPRPNIRASVLQLDDKQAGQEAAQHLIAAHCQTLFFVGRNDISASRERLAGAEEVARQAGVPFQFLNCSLNYTAGLKLGRELQLPEQASPSGIIATNDWLAVGLHAGLAMRTPGCMQAIHMISFDGLPLTAGASPDIESLVVPVESIASDAVAELYRLHRSQASVGRIVRYQLYLRA